MLRDPPPGEMPVAVAPYRPDLLARRGGERVAVEVADRADSEGLERVVELARLFSTLPGWRLDLVVLEAMNGAEEPARVLSPERIRDRARAAVEVAERTSDHAAALLLLWTAIEATLHHKVQAADERPDEKDSRRLIKQALSLGLLDEDDARTLDQVAATRDALAHGRERTAPLREAFRRAQEVLGRILQPSLRQLPRSQPPPPQITRSTKSSIASGSMLPRLAASSAIPAFTTTANTTAPSA